MNSILTDEEVQKLVIALGRGQAQFTEEEAIQVVQWAHKVKIDAGILRLVMNGMVVLSIKDGEVAVGLPDQKKDILDSEIIH